MNSLKKVLFGAAFLAVLFLSGFNHSNVNASETMNPPIPPSYLPTIAKIEVSPNPMGSGIAYTTGVATTINLGAIINGVEMDFQGNTYNCNAVDGLFDSAIEEFYCYPLTPRLTQEGFFDLVLRATDTSGQTSVDYITPVQVDLTAPDITLQAGTISTNTTPVITGLANDLVVNLRNVKFQVDTKYYDSKYWNDCSADDGAFDSSKELFSCKISYPLAYGEHTIYVVAQDSLGNSQQFLLSQAYSSVKYTVDNIGPVVTPSSTNNDDPNTSTPILNVFVADDYSMIAGTYYQIDSMSGQWLSCKLITIGGGLAESFRCVVEAPLSNGRHTVYFKSVDALGNESEITKQVFTVDSTGPVVTLLASNVLSPKSPTPVFAGSVVDSYSTIASVYYQVDGTNGTWLACEARDNSFDEMQEDFSCAVGNQLTEGNHTIYVKAVDALGNESAVVNQTFAVQYAASVYRFWSPILKSHFYTIDEAEKSYVERTYPGIWQYEEVAFKAYMPNNDGVCTYPNTKPVYRFWSRNMQTHFYTMNEVEKQYVSTHYEDATWHYEQVAYCAYETQTDGTQAVYRFWSQDLETHFYTMNVAERDYVINHYDDNVWKYEDIAWYAIPAGN